MDIAIIDYGIGNLRSAEKAFQKCGFDAHLTSDPAVVRTARKIVLPGVGAFGACMSALNASGMVETLLGEVASGKPLLGICVGLQMLFESSEENPGARGLGLLKGAVRRFQTPTLKVPQIGWNGLTYPASKHPLFENLPEDSHVYFVHSYFAQPRDASDVLAWSDYGGRFCAAAGRGNVLGVQFHPEKSQTVGLSILKNFGTLP